jgi:hypothetical protein
MTTLYSPPIPNYFPIPNPHPKYIFEQFISQCHKCKNTTVTFKLEYNHPDDDLKYIELSGIPRPFGMESCTVYVCDYCFKEWLKPKYFTIHFDMWNRKLIFTNGTHQYFLKNEDIDREIKEFIKLNDLSEYGLKMLIQ